MSKSPDKPSLSALLGEDWRDGWEKNPEYPGVEHHPAGYTLSFPLSAALEGGRATMTYFGAHKRCFASAEEAKKAAYRDIQRRCKCAQAKASVQEYKAS